MAIGIVRAGLLGGVAAWLGFTLPSAVALVAFAYALRTVGFGDAGWLHGLKVVAVAVVAQAVWGMARSLAPDRARASLAVLAALVVLAVPNGRGAGARHRRGRSARVDVPSRPRRRRTRPRCAWRAAREGPRRRVACRCSSSCSSGCRSPARWRRATSACRVRQLLPRGLPRLRRRPRGAAAAPGRGRHAGLGDKRRSSSPAMARPRRCPARSSHSPPISAP